MSRKGWLLQAVLSFGSEGALLQLLTQGLRGASTNMLGLGVGPRPMAVMPDIKVWAFSAVFMIVYGNHCAQPGLMKIAMVQLLSEYTCLCWEYCAARQWPVNTTKE